VKFSIVVVGIRTVTVNCTEIALGRWRKICIYNFSIKRRF